MLAFYQRRANFLGAGRDIWTLSVDDGSEPQPFLRTPFNERSPSFSPVGHWLAYTSNESGEDQIYIQAYPGPGAKITVSRHGGHEPVWSRDGRELFFRNGGEVWAAAITHGSSLNGLDVSEPALLFDGPYAASTDGDGSQTYDAAPDGRFIMVEPDESSSSRLVVVLNWVEELKRLVPSKP
ncbi:MAG: hypothetical protein BMS9Abin37_3137 [Acidobacteriota bacterium]|nr:MAG: hypothetical protein BMS9Abin37_3137 [Acidobacteriota bacterium]